MGRITDLKREGVDRTSRLLAGEKSILEMIALGRPLREMLEALARTIEQQAEGLICSILLLDEATSSLDSLTEEEISRTIREVATNQEAITILIAHRLSTVMHADRIFVLERGHIVEFGHHSELLDQKGLYYAMWRQQVGEREAITATS